MTVEVENQPHCVATLHIELPPEQVLKEWDAIANNFARFARIPGYRPGKAPRRVVEAKFRKDIQDEVTKKLVSQSYREAVAENQLRVVALTNLEDVEFGQDRSMRFRATVVTAPEFELPEYKNIPVQVASAQATEEEIGAALERMREQAADFVDVSERGLQMGDFAIIDFTGSVDGKSISEIAPDASKNLQDGKKFWLHLAPKNFLPQFCDQLIGQKREETRSVRVEFPAEFPVMELAGKTADYNVTLREIKQRVLPALDDAFAAKLMPDKNLADLRHLLEHQLEHEKEHEIERAKETQIIKFLHERTQFEIPPTLLTQETRRALAELVQRNRERGIPDDALKTKEKELIEAAGALAANRLKTNFILHRVAESEKIAVNREDVDQHIRREAARYNITAEKMRKELEEHDRLNGLVEEILLGKTLAFLQANVSLQPGAKLTPAEAIS
ncbi:MAG: trigger factor [Verrucomicrobiota bacterium]